jgi:hypothetical protein
MVTLEITLHRRTINVCAVLCIDSDILQDFPLPGRDSCSPRACRRRKPAQRAYDLIHLCIFIEITLISFGVRDQDLVLRTLTSLSPNGDLAFFNRHLRPQQLQILG